MDIFSIVAAGASLLIVLSVVRWLATPQPIIYVQLDKNSKPVPFEEKSGSPFGLLMVIAAIVLFVLYIGAA